MVMCGVELQVTTPNDNNTIPNSKLKVFVRHLFNKSHKMINVHDKPQSHDEYQDYVILARDREISSCVRT